MVDYHLKRKEKEIKNREKLRMILSKGKYITISMCKENEPYIVTMNYGYDQKNNALYFHCAKQGLKLEFLRENRNVCATIIEDNGYIDGQCDHAFRSIVIWGEMNFVKEIEEKKYGIGILIRHLEKEPDEVFKKLLNKREAFQRFLLLRLDIHDLIGKENSN